MGCEVKEVTSVSGEGSDGSGEGSRDGSGTRCEETAAVSIRYPETEVDIEDECSNEYRSHSDNSINTSELLTVESYHGSFTR